MYKHDMYASSPSHLLNNQQALGNKEAEDYVDAAENEADSHAATAWHNLYKKQMELHDADPATIACGLKLLAILCTTKHITENNEQEPTP